MQCRAALKNDRNGRVQAGTDLGMELLGGLWKSCMFSAKPKAGRMHCFPGMSLVKRKEHFEA